MNAVTKILSRVLGKIPARGTLMTPSGEETYPIAICNEIMGGPFIVDSLDELKEIPFERLLKGCKCTVNEHSIDGKIQPTTTYSLRGVPQPTIEYPKATSLADIPNSNISDYWVLDMPRQQEESAVQYQYAPDYSNEFGVKTKPLFMSSAITKEAYNAGYFTTTDFESGDTSKIMWEDEYNVQTHVWLRQRSSALADWGIPMKIDEEYTEGTYMDVRFQWRDIASGKPVRPASLVDGVVNNEPIGWDDVPNIPDGEVFETYRQTHDLWRISATKNTYQQLISEWSDPVSISTDPQLIRFGVDAMSTEYFNELYWRPYYSLGDRYKATRPTVNDPWEIEMISGESGEYKDMVFKQFPKSYEPTIVDAPKTKLGYGTDNWYDGVFVADEGYTLYVSTCRKYSNGEQISNWTLPVRFDGKSTTRNVITVLNNTGSSFKYSMSAGVQVVVPSTIQIKAVLFDADKEISINDYNVKWYRGTIDQVQNGTATLIVKGAPGQPVISGTNDIELTISPNHVDTKQVFTAVSYLQGEDYYDDITIYDVTDGVGYVPLIDASAGYIFKESETKTFTGYLFENGVDISTVSGVTYYWTLNGDAWGTTRSVNVTRDDVDGSEILELTVSFQGNSYKVTEAIVDVVDGKSMERQYSPLETLVNINYTPDYLNNPNQWSTNATGAIWVIERMSGDDWGIPYRVKGEKGVPNGAFQKTVYKLWNPAAPGTEWRYTQPTTKTAPTDNLIPTGPISAWLENPPTDAPTGSTIYGSKATFLKNPTNESIEEVVANWNIQGTGWSLPFKVTYFAADGVGTAGPQGYNGYSPVFAAETYGESRVLKVVSWTGGTGAAPASPVYIGPSGFVTLASQAVNIRGVQGITGPKGNDGVFNASTDFWDPSTYTINKVYTINHGSILRGYTHVNILFKKSRFGSVYYTGAIYVTNIVQGGFPATETEAVNELVNITLPSEWVNNMCPLSNYNNYSENLNYSTFDHQGKNLNNAGRISIRKIDSIYSLIIEPATVYKGRQFDTRNVQLNGTYLGKV